MKKVVLSIISAFFCICFCTVTVYAEEPSVSYEESLRTLFESSGTQDLLEEQRVQTALDAQGIRVDNPDSIQSFSFQTFLEDELEKAAASAAEPFRMFGMLLGVILLSAFAESMQSERSGSTAAIYEMVSTLCAVVIFADPLSALFSETSQTLQSSADFMLTFSTIFAGVLAACGGLTSAAGYQAAMIGVCEIAMQLAAKVMLPVLSMGLAMSIVDAVNPVISLEGMIRLIHKGTVWVLGLVMSLFLGILSVQSMVSVSADGLSAKTTRFVISNMIPFVGNAVSDAYTTVLSSMGVLKSATGLIGIVSILSLLLPLLLELGIYRFFMAVGSAVAEMFAAKHLQRLLSNVERMIATAFSVAVSFSVLFIVSTGVMLMLGGSLMTA